VISDNYFSATVISKKEKGLGHVLFKHLTLSFIRFHSQPRRLATATAITVYICLNRPLPGAPLGGLPFYSTHNTCLFGLIYKTTAPVLVSYGLLPHPSLGSGNFHCRDFYSGSLWFYVVPHIELSRVVLCGRDTSASSSVTKNPATNTSRLRAPCPG
jgi:hypothetical protein